MAAKLNTLSYLEVRAATDKSLGRNICEAEVLEMTDFGDCVRNDFWWPDGACFSMLHDTKVDALDQAQSAGFTLKRQPQPQPA